jgi:uracil-DNA glycosylase
MARDILGKVEAQEGVDVAANICPRPEDIFAFARTPFAHTRVIIVGMDPYPNRNHATGICFSVPDGTDIPPSLRNIFACLISKRLMRETSAKCGNLMRWTEQGVLLLNYALTTHVGRSSAHLNLWQPFADKLISAISRELHGAIFMLFGKKAQAVAPRIASSVAILTYGHPSPLNPANRDVANSGHFVHCELFGLANNMLRTLGQRAIDWDPIARADDTDSSRDLNPDPFRAAQILTTEIMDPADQMNPPDTDDRIYAFIDGSCRTIDGQKVAQYGAILIIADMRIKIKGRVANSVDAAKSLPTNNRAELCAILALLSHISSREFIDEYGSDPITIVYDSEYAKGCVTEWYEQWMVNPPNEMKKNRDIIALAYDKWKLVCAARAVTWVHVHGHMREPDFIEDARKWFYWYGNNRVDALCTEATS